MTDGEILNLTKLNLSMATTAYDAYLTALIGASKDSIAREGIVLDLSSSEDVNIVVMYAAYLFRKRAEDSPAMPRMLRYALNNRLFSQKAGEADG